MPDFSARATLDEQMDDLTASGPALTQALDGLRSVNRWLGGVSALLHVVEPFLRTREGQRVDVLDLGTGAADLPEALVRWGDEHGVDVHVVGLDANPAVVAYAREAVDERLPPYLRSRIEVRAGDALRVDARSGAFDLALASMFAHHFSDADLVRLLREMDRLARHGLVVNDLHRHPIAYHSIVALSRILPVSPMFRHDAPISVLRGFRRAELRAAAAAAGLRGARVRWHWAFRWTLSTIDPRPSGQESEVSQRLEKRTRGMNDRTRRPEP